MRTLPSLRLGTLPPQALDATLIAQGDTVLQRIRATRQQKESGFTLTELLIVIVILGILAGVVVFAVQAFQDRGKTAACKADFRSAEVAVEAYYAQNSAYPNDWDQIVPQYLRTQPDGGGNYTIFVYTNGVVRATGACTEGPANAPAAPVAVLGSLG
jgi:general secretion pathway protein G